MRDRYSHSHGLGLSLLMADLPRVVDGARGADVSRMNISLSLPCALVGNRGATPAVIQTLGWACSRPLAPSLAPRLGAVSCLRVHPGPCASPTNHLRSSEVSCPGARVHLPVHKPGSLQGRLFGWDISIRHAARFGPERA
jgi:hypothetical protein